MAYLGVALEFALSMVVGLLLGHLADRRLGTTPIFSVAGFFLGLGAGAGRAYRLIKKAN